MPVAAQAQANTGAARNPPSAVDGSAEGIAQKAAHPLSQKPGYPPDRPPTKREDTQQMMSGMPGYMTPEVPREVQQAQAGTGEYVMVDSEQGRR